MSFKSTFAIAIFYIIESPSRPSRKRRAILFDANNFKYLLYRHTCSLYPTRAREQPVVTDYLLPDCQIDLACAWAMWQCGNVSAPDTRSFREQLSRPCATESKSCALYFSLPMCMRGLKSCAPNS